VGPRRYEIEFLGTTRPLEAKLIPRAGFRLQTVQAAGLKGIGGLRWLRNFLILPRTAFAVGRILREFQPHVVLGVGGYLAGPALLEAALAGIPTVLIEPNATPGLTNRLLAPMVRAAALGFAETAHVYGTKAHMTGHPVRREFFAIPPRHRAAQALLPVQGRQPGAAQSPAQPGVAVPPAAQAHEPELPFTILVVGGSQGSRAINQAVRDTVPLLAGEAYPIRVVHQSGEHDYNELRKSYDERGLPVEVQAFIDDMPSRLAQADLVISRAGATAVTELAAAGRASILVPFPGATDQHQLENARVMEKAGAARVILQAELTPVRLAKEIQVLVADPAGVGKMEAAARCLARPDAAERIADLVEAVSCQLSA
jgi:UDP-N-acetylglucosamine--N-acetylmuramyl-(pentapeptide) pyrophosphoryl-undecaprenol N-acetylglucosamine transferase